MTGPDSGSDGGGRHPEFGAEGGASRVLPRASGARRHKALAPWRFGFVRREAKPGGALDENPCGLEATEMSCETVEGRELSASLGEGGGEEGESDTPAGDGDGEVSKGGGGGGGGDSNSDGLDGDLVAKDCDPVPKDREFPQSIGNNAVTAEPHGAVEPSGLQGLQSNGAADGSDPVGLDCDSMGLRTAQDTVPGCRKGRKAVAPWRFMPGYKPKWSQGISSGCGSNNGQTETPTSEGTDVSQQCATAMPRNRSRVRAPATSNRTSAKAQKGSGSAPKKRKVDKGGHHQVPPNNRIALVRENVLTTLREFRMIYKKLLEEEEVKWRERGRGPRPDLAAFNIYRERFCVNNDDTRYDGSIPGVRIGDVFNSTMELSIVGMHRAQSLSVDYINKKDGTCLAVSVLSHAQPSAFDKNLDFLLHFGSVAATGDQKLEGADLALNESMETDTPVRVIHAIVTELHDNCQPKRVTSYVYGGLYLVEKFHRERTNGDKFVSTFHLRRMEGQPHINLQEVLKTRLLEPFDGTFIGDISGGLEKMPISAINSLSNEHPPKFRYMSQIQYPSNHQPDPQSGCDCVGGCSISQKCACIVKNGGVFPYNNIGCILEERPLIFECGPSCKCPPTCYNRVSQNGIKFRLQVFKTKSMGWGVRSLDFIPSGSFVCEYIGELLEEGEAQERRNDEYLFAIGNNYDGVDRWEDMIKTIPALQNGPSEDEEMAFAVDALNQGSFARFINHSCTPNLFPQNVLHDHDNIKLPHIMFFAEKDIPAFQELSYDYNYGIDKVYDSDGNIKKKPCFCGSVECTGRLY